MKAIDLFAGAGGFSTGAVQAGCEVLWAANHWPAAIAAHSANHPDTVHLCQDLHQADWTKVPAHDLLMASPSCVPACAQIQTLSGHILAKDIKVGDLVLTHEGRERHVINVWSKAYAGDMVSLTMWGTTREKVEMTADHLVWVKRRGGHYAHFGAPQFRKAGDVRAGDRVAFPRPKPVSGTAAAYVVKCRPLQVGVYDIHKVSLSGADPDLWWLVGHYLGDGAASSSKPRGGANRKHVRHEITWSTGGNKENRAKVKRICAQLGLRTWEHGPETNMNVTASSTWLHALCVSFGRLCYVKHIPDALLGLEDEYAQALLEGYLAADGSHRTICGVEMWRATSVSLPLLQGCMRLCWQIGWAANISLGGKAGTAVIEGRSVNVADTWELTLRKIPSSQSRTVYEGEYLWRTVKAVTRTPVKDETVYDFEVEEDHTFCLPGVVVHNCQGFSRARGTHQPRHDVARSTAWAVVSAVECHRPPVALVENVPEFQKWALFPAWSAAMQALGYSVSPHVVDAADCGVPQHRVRLFVVLTKSKAPLILDLPKKPHVAARTVIDFNVGKWSLIDRPGRSEKTLMRVKAGRERFGERFLIAYYGSVKGGRSLDRPIGTLTTCDRYGIVDGARMRMVSIPEAKAFMSFPASYILPPDHKTALHLLGNAVCPEEARTIIEAIKAAA